MAATLRKLCSAFALLAVAVAFVVAALPEPASVMLTPRDGWSVKGQAGMVGLSQFPDQYRHVRQSAASAPAGILYRSWTPQAGVQPIEVESPPFRAPGQLVVAVTGATRTPGGKTSAFLTCSDHAQRRPIFLGSANVAVVEAFVDLPQDWCTGATRLHLAGGDASTNVGIGAAYEVGRLSALKRSFIGLLPYLLLSLALPGLVCWTGAAATKRLLPAAEAPVAAAAFLGIACLFAFCAYAALPKGWSGLVPVAGVALLALLAAVAGRGNLAESASALRPYGMAWAFAAVGYFALASAAGNGLGHWEPNYRFWPAIWSSDNELPWMFAEAVRLDLPLKELYGGAWKPTDRPPLMAGAHLLVADAFALLQSFNDGSHLRGLAFNAAAVAFGALWVPAALYLLHAALRLPVAQSHAVVALAALLPFAIFNTIYGWPKAFGALFGLLAAAAFVMALRGDNGREVRVWIVSFGVFAALGMLSHGSTITFLLPMGVWLAVARLRSGFGALVAAGAVAAALYLPWPVFQRLALPSHDPVVRFALVGDFGFGQPGKGIGAALAELYSGLSLSQWAEIKWRMLVQPLWPLSTSVAPLGLNSDWGADVTGFLRAWDSLLLSAGNAAVLVSCGVAIAFRLGWEPRRSAALAAGGDTLSTASLLIGVAGLAWLTMALVFMAPLMLHHWPYAAVFAAASAAFAGVLLGAPRLFGVMGIAQWLYASLVWFVMPLREAASVAPLPAALALLALVALLPLLLRVPIGRGFVPAGVAAGRPGAALFSPRRRLEFRLQQGWLQWGLPAGPATVSGAPGIRRVLAAAAVLLALALLLHLGISLQRPLIDDHSFRQAQTAISVFQTVHGGPWVDYWTPVFGSPWTIPFEAPVYQTSVALVALLLPLEFSGRLVSALYLLGAVFVGTRFLKLWVPAGSAIPLAFAVLGLAAPLHLFWGRAFLIESCAVFFGIASVHAGIRFLRDGGGTLLLASTAAGILCVLAKATTWPGFAVMLGCAALLEAWQAGKVNLRRLGALALGAALALAAGLAWTQHADGLKALSPLGTLITSASLRGFNYGTLAQRFGKELWEWTLPGRMLPDILGTLWPLAIAAIVIAGVVVAGRMRALLVLLLLAFLTPLMLFTNLHLVHNYYQMANAIFLLLAAAVAIGSLIDGRLRIAGVGLLAAVVAGQVAGFAGTHWPKTLAPNVHDQIVEAATVARDGTASGDALLVIGDEWSSLAHYYAQRRGIAFPTWAPDAIVDKVLTDLPAQLGGQRLGAIIDCREVGQGKYSSRQSEQFDELIRRFRAQAGAQEQRRGRCVVLSVPKAPGS